MKTLKVRNIDIDTILKIYNDETRDFDELKPFESLRIVGRNSRSIFFMSSFVCKHSVNLTLQGGSYNYHKNIVINHDDGFLLRNHSDWIAKSLLNLLATCLGQNSDITLSSNFKKIKTILNRHFLIDKFTPTANPKSLLDWFLNDCFHRIRLRSNHPDHIRSTTASDYQSIYILFLVHAFGVDKLSLIQGFKLIKANFEEVEHTEGIDETLLSKQFSYYTFWFRALCNIIEIEPSLPHRFTVMDRQYWCADALHPNGLGKFKKGASNYCIQPDSETISSTYYNLEKGRPWTHDEARQRGIYHLFCSFRCRKKKNNRSIWDNFHQNMPLSVVYNNAVSCYAMHFLYVTGANDSVLSTLSLENYSISNANRARFKVIKLRANGKVVEFEIQTHFIEDFLSYLRMRAAYISKSNKQTDKLFFYTHSTKQTAGLTSTSIISKLKEKPFAPEFKLHTSRNIRLTKGLWIRKYYGTEVTAYILNHSSNVSLRSYTNSNHEKYTAIQLTNYFEKVKTQLDKNEDLHRIAIHSGGCKEPGSPVSVDETPVEVNCKSTGGCLFCDNYAPHADEEDIRKILSLRFCLEKLRINARSQDHYNRVIQPVIEKANFWLDEMKKFDKRLIQVVQKIEQEVYIFNRLSEYWESKYSDMIELGIL